MEKGKETHAPHCLILPYPIQGHINPMLQFSKRLTRKGVRITFVVTKFLRKTVQELSSSSNISIAAISDGFDSGGRAEANSTEAYLAKFHLVGVQTLSQLVDNLKSNSPVDCIIYDPFLSWGLDVAKKLGLVSAAFFTQSCAVNNVYYHVHKEDLKLPLSEKVVNIGGLPEMEPSDLPSFVYVHGSYPAAFEMILAQFHNLEKADWILVNTFHKLEQEVIEWMAKFLRVKAIGPTVPSMYLDKRLQDDKEYGLSVFKPNADVCMKWLDERATRSVVYVSFGSLAELGEEQMEELARGLMNSNKYFLWVVRLSEEAKLPKNFLEDSTEKGLIVSWCPQLEVLAHEAIGCFVTHCGWNSTLEALSLGVPMVAMPQWTDQSTNAKFVESIWRMGIKATRDEKGIVEEKEIARCIKCMMEDDRGDEIRKNAIKWKETAREAVDEGGSSDTNIQEFISSLCYRKSLYYLVNCELL